jgi:hypothetical protein
MVTKEQAIAMQQRTEVHYGECKDLIGPRGGRKQFREVWRVNGACKTWKTRPDEFSLPIKYGYNGPYTYITETNCHKFHLATECMPTEVHSRA